MPTTLSFSLPTALANRTKKIAKQRGFKGVSEYLRHLVREDEGPMITADTLAQRHVTTAKLAKQGKLVEVDLEDLV
jgi:Arc/MetJ-type ribon-helix-helix transcriptional regulator